MSDRPPAPTRPVTPSLDALLQKYQPGQPRWTLTRNGDVDNALWLLDHGNELNGNAPVSQADRDALPPEEVTLARVYAMALPRWCDDYNGGLMPGQGSNEQTATLDQLAAKAQTGLAGASSPGSTPLVSDPDARARVDAQIAANQPKPAPAPTAVVPPRPLTFVGKFAALLKKLHLA